MKKQKTIVVCASASVYEKLFPIKNELISLGYKVILPKVAEQMKKQNDFNVKKIKTWYKNPNDYKKKQQLIKEHFSKIIKGDAVLVVNYDKNDLKGYIGGNTLMEITIALHSKKPIFILNPIAEELIIKEEIYGVLPFFLNGDLNLISKHV